MKILIECKADQLFLEKVFSSRKGITLKHGRNKSEIIKFLTKREYIGSLGMIDEDPHVNPPSYLLQHYKKHIETDAVIVYRNFENRTSLIVLRPRLEEFVLNIAKNAKIDPNDCGLPSNGEKLHAIINLQLKSFNKLMEKIVDHHSPSLKKLKEIFDGEIKWASRDALTRG